MMKNTESASRYLIRSSVSSVVSRSVHKEFWDSCVSGVGITKNRALNDNYLKLCMVLGMDMTFSKTTAHKLGETPGGRYAQNPRWPPLETEYHII